MATIVSDPAPVPGGRRGKFTRGPAKHGSAQALSGFLRFLTTQPDGNGVAHGVHFGLLTGRQPLRTGLHVLPGDCETLELVGEARESTILNTQPDVMSTDEDSPLTFTLKTGISTFESLADTVARYPIAGADRPLLERYPDAELACMPLIRLGTATGVLTTLFARPPKRTWADREFADGVMCGIALWAAGLGTASQQARAARPVPAVMSATARQADILALLRNGLTQSRIAHLLGCSHSTVKNDLAALGTKLGATSTKDLLRLAELAGM